MSGSASMDFGFGQVVFGLAEGVELDGDRFDLGAFARQLAELIHVVGRIGRGQHAVDFVEAIDQQLKFLADARFHGIGPAVRMGSGGRNFNRDHRSSAMKGNCQQGLMT